jgi:hypothetical protein
VKSDGRKWRVSPSGTITIKDGTTQQFGIVTSSGFTILSVTGCNGTLSKTSGGFTYTTGRVTGSCTVIASFKLLAPKISSFKINNDAVETAIQSVSLNFSMATGSTPTGFNSRVDELDATSVCSIVEGPADNLQATQVATRILGQQGNDLPLGCYFTFFDAKTLH